MPCSCRGRRTISQHFAQALPEHVGHDPRPRRVQMVAVLCCIESNILMQGLGDRSADPAFFPGKPTVKGGDPICEIPPVARRCVPPSASTTLSAGRRCRTDKWPGPARASRRMA